MNRAFCVCVPAREEADRIATLIAALAAQTVDRPVPIALCVNNSDDGTAIAAADAAARAEGRVELHVIERTFEQHLAHAGSARRAAMALGAGVVGEDDGLLISTDADCRPPPEWIAANLEYAGRDRILGGRIALDEQESVARAIATLRQRFDLYWQAVRAIEDIIDPLPWDPAPRHGDHTGASLAIEVALYHRAGGVPLLESGEDRALVDAAVQAGGILVHPPAIWTRASARTSGRAAAGMADDMQRWERAVVHNEPLRVPAFDHWRARAAWRRRHRLLSPNAPVSLAERLLDPMPCDMALPEL